MSVRIACGLSTERDARSGARSAAERAGAGLDGAPADLAVVFACGAHLAAPGTALEAVADALTPREMIGCGAGGVLAGGREVEDGTAIAVWAAALGDGTAETFHAVVEPADEGAALTGMPPLAGASGAILLTDPYTFPTDGVLDAVAPYAPGVPVLGGLASARTLDGGAAVFLGREVVSEGAVGVRLEGVEMLPCVSQGAAPLGPEMEITAAEGHVIRELGGEPALTRLRSTILELPDDERERVADGLLVGIALGGGAQDDFLVRGLVGADPEEGSVALGSAVEAGQVLRLHARDAQTADRDLRDALALRRTALGGAAPAGALVFSCNGRGRGLFGRADHDAHALQDAFGAPVPAAGFFAAGEIGPVGGGNFLHGFTATMALFT